MRKAPLIRAEVLGGESVGLLNMPLTISLARCCSWRCSLHADHWAAVHVRHLSESGGFSTKPPFRFPFLWAVLTIKDTVARLQV